MGASMQTGLLIPGQKPVPGLFASIVIVLALAAGPVFGAPEQKLRLSSVATSWNEIALSWTDTTRDRSGYIVERAPSAAGPWLTAGTAGADARAFTDRGLQPATFYFYRVSSLGGSLPPITSNAQRVRTRRMPRDVDSPLAPSGLVARTASENPGCSATTSSARRASSPMSRPPRQRPR
jgi:hypothetical protein